MCTLLYVLAPPQCPPTPACAWKHAASAPHSVPPPTPSQLTLLGRVCPGFHGKLEPRTISRGMSVTQTKPPWSTPTHREDQCREPTPPPPGREGSYSLRKEEQKTDCGRNQRDWLQRETSWSTSTSPERSPGPSLLLGALTRPHLRGAGWGLCGSERQRPYLGSGDCSWRLCSPQPLTPDWELGLKPKRVEVPIHRSTRKTLVLKRMRLTGPASCPAGCPPCAPSLKLSSHWGGGGG